MEKFFQYQFEINASQVEGFIQFAEVEELTEDHLVQQLFSQILNMHHIWNARIKNQSPEVEEFDVMPSSHWCVLNQSNHQETFELIKFTEWGSALFIYESSRDYFPEQILQHILKQSVYKQGRLEQRFNELGFFLQKSNLVKTIAW